jgi:hypothetical protein
MSKHLDRKRRAMKHVVIIPGDWPCAGSLPHRFVNNHKDDQDPEAVLPHLK